MRFVICRSREEVAGKRTTRYAFVLRNTMEIPCGNAISRIPFIALFAQQRSPFVHYSLVLEPSNGNNILLRHHGGGRSLCLCGDISGKDGTPCHSTLQDLSSSAFPHYLRKREFPVSLLASSNKMHSFKRFACPEATNCIRPAGLRPLGVTSLLSS